MDASSKTLLLLTLLSTHCLAASVPHGVAASNPMVLSSDGWLEGLRMTVKGTDQAVNAYLGVPFAKPPLGSRRFSAPQPAEPWTGVRNATSFPPTCLQSAQMADKAGETLKMKFPKLPASEDCLYLNLYSPANADENSKLPVMVWIHGGGLTMGSASLVHGSALAAHENLIVVCIQYRLGVTGFFSTGDEHARGNWGFLDQVAALQWVNRSISAFGGDPTSVTIFGESAGGISTSAHVLSSLSKGLFHKAISQSGVLVFPGVVTNDVATIRGIAKMIANLSGCETTDSSTMVACMKRTPGARFPNIEINQKVPFVPAVVDGHFLLKTPQELLIGKEINAVPYLIGCNNHEFGWIIPMILGLPDLRNGMDRLSAEQFMVNAAPWLGEFSEFRHLIMEEYLGGAQDPFQIRDNFLDLFGDTMFAVQTVLRARYHRDAGLPTYLYEFQHRPSMFRDLKPPYVKADHGDDLFFVLGVPFLDDIISQDNFTEEERTLSKNMMKSFANFARNGNPNGAGLCEWPLYGLTEEYLEINLQMKVASKLKDQRVTFWTQTLPKKIEEIKKQRKGA
ncbi:fatty acyl-CoA hydrolase precursor, medium chain-like [Ambystoma mexicanum]|uniref:fatty acyl-CoA hydrolase precursor, medium chain-like n=1 Tax=Ambystoma mexicanum TaxID=8296 RepID=UPI0037E7C848